MSNALWLFIGIATTTYIIFETLLIRTTRKEGENLDFTAFLTLNIGIGIISAITGGVALIIKDLTTNWNAQWTKDLLSFLIFLTICAIVMAIKIGLYHLSKNWKNIEKRERKEEAHRKKRKLKRQARARKKATQERKNKQKKKTR